MEQKAIEHIEASMIAKTLTLRLNDEGLPAHLVPPNYTLQSLEKYQEHPSRFRGSYRTQYVEEFADYVKANNAGTAHCFVDAKKMCAEAILDFGDVEHPGHCEHTASVELVPTADWNGLNSVLATNSSQRDFVEWMEDWRENLTALDQHENPIEIKAAISAVRALTIDVKLGQEHVTNNLSASKSTLESIEAGSKGRTLPAFLVFNCAPYDELELRAFRCRIGVLTGGKEPALVLRLVQADSIYEKMAQEFKALVATSFPDTFAIHIGTFKKG